MKLWHARYAIPARNGVRTEEADFYLPSATAVRRAIVERGHVPIAVDPRVPAKVEWWDIKTTGWQIQLLRALRNQLEHVAPNTALQRIAENESDRRRKIALTPVLRVLAAGGSFGDALRALNLFDRPVLAILTTGDQSGGLAETIDHAIAHLEEKAKQRRSMLMTLGWLVFDLVSIVSSVFGTQFWYLPYLRQSGIQSHDPAAIARFQHYLSLAEWVNGGLVVLCTAMMLAMIVAGAMFSYDRRWATTIIASCAVRLPVFSSYALHASMVDTSLMLSRLLRGRVALDKAITIVAENTLETRVKAYWRACLDAIDKGSTPQRALARPPWSSMERQHIMAIQKGSQLADLMPKLAQERTFKAAAARRNLVLIGVVFLMTVFGIGVAVSAGLVWLQNEGLVATMDSMRR